MFSQSMLSNLGSVVLYVKAPLLHRFGWRYVVKESKRL